MQVKKQQLELDKEQRTGSKLGKEYVKCVYCHPAYLTYMQSTSCEMLGWMKHKLESRLWGEMSITSDMQKTPPYWHKAKREWPPTPVFLPGESHGQMSLAGDNPWGCKEQDTAEQVNWMNWNELMGLNVMILVFGMLSFKPAFSLPTFIKRLFSSSLSAIRVVSSAYLRY